MSIIFVHLSDIHFGQEKLDNDKGYFVHTDVRERLIDDVKKFAGEADHPIVGVLVTGDIAYGGTATEYDEAGQWLDRVTAAAGCKREDVQIVPGNHDIDWAQISSAVAYLLKEIEEGGEDRLNEFLADQTDREILYRRFHAYSDFAVAYSCPLDKQGGGAGDRLVEIAPGRKLRFVGLNTALACSKGDKEGNLLLGERQRVLPRSVGEELVVLAHHPLKWMQDADDAIQYVRSRARVLMTGHEHTPSVKIENVGDGADLMMLEAGATTPPGSEKGYTYTYNFIEFAWDAGTDGLSVTVTARTWCEESKDFVADTDRKDLDGQPFILAAPNFRKGAKVKKTEVEASDRSEDVPVVEQEISAEVLGPTMPPDDYPQIILRFFRDLLPGQRLKLLVDLGAVPDTWSEPLSQGNERQLLDRIIRDGKVQSLRDGIEAFTGGRDSVGGKND